jgi:DNA-binding response OmpR family regulator
MSAQPPLNDDPFTILVVDDHPGMCAMVSANLHRLGYRMMSAPDGETALRLAGAEDAPQIHLLLTDYRMPVMFGDELAVRFRRAHPATAIIVMSGETPASPLPPGCQFLAKPFHFTMLREKIEAALSPPDET